MDILGPEMALMSAVRVVAGLAPMFIATTCGCMIWRDEDVATTVHG